MSLTTDEYLEYLKEVIQLERKYRRYDVADEYKKFLVNELFVDVLIDKDNNIELKYNHKRWIERQNELD